MLQFDLLHGLTIISRPSPPGEHLRGFGDAESLASFSLAAVPTECRHCSRIAGDWPQHPRWVRLQPRRYLANLGMCWAFTLEAFTLTFSALGTNGLYQFPLFNRNTIVSLDATFDLEAAVASFSPKEKEMSRNIRLARPSWPPLSSAIVPASSRH